VCGAASLAGLIGLPLSNWSDPCVFTCIHYMYEYVYVHMNLSVHRLSLWRRSFGGFDARILHTHLQTKIDIYIHANIHTNNHIHTHIHTYIYLSLLRALSHSLVLSHTHSLHVYGAVSRALAPQNTFTYTHTYPYTHVHTYVHTLIYMCIHIYTLSLLHTCTSECTRPHTTSAHGGHRR